MTYPSGFCYLALAAALVVLPAASAVAAWNGAAEPIRGYPTWIYTPSTVMPNGQHALLIVLHGCAQTHDDIKSHGNLAPAADAHGLVVAVPSVGAKAWQGSTVGRCWDYDGAADKQGNIADLISLANKLKARAGLNIDPRHVYVTGLSSGATLALELACKAPDVFAGVGAVAGASVGSNQNFALNDALFIPLSNVDDAVEKCRSLAGSKAAALSTQVASIAYGDMDMNGAKARFPFFGMDAEQRAQHAGQISLVSVKWGDDNAAALRRLYGTAGLGLPQAVQGRLGTQYAATKNGQARVALLVVHDVGHAWPAGGASAGGAFDAAGALARPPGGIWIARGRLNYPDHIARWLIGNNLRARLGPGPQVSASAAVSAAGGVAVSGTARSATRLSIALFNARSGRQLARHDGVAVAGDGSYADTFGKLGEGVYEVEVVASDDANANATVLSDDVAIGHPPPQPFRCINDNNVNHVLQGRAQACGIGFVCAVGSGQTLGWFNVFITSGVVENPQGYFKRAMCRGR